MSNKNIIQKAIKGDHHSLKRLYDKNIESMFASSYRITNDIQASEDIIQESFLTSFAKLSNLSDKNNYQGWLRRIVINNSLKYLKNKNRFKEINTDSILSMHDEEEVNWFTEITFDVIQSAIQELPNSARAVFSLYALEGFKHREIAEIQSISEATSKTQYRYAKKLLKESLTKKINNEV